ncbi:MAG: tRNA (adenosine(37)-N6)-threonylcarbamoyltransferase complex ATPase subunit type 1 TsaE [Pseudomonadota bacterium]
MKHTTKSSDATFELASNYAKKLKAGDILALIGELGAGKTRFVQGLAYGLGVPDTAYVRSPSFILMNEYKDGRIPLYHFDFYRLTDPEELGDLGLDEYFFGTGVTVVEWADRFPGALPARTKTIRFTIVGEEEREIQF